MGAPLHTVSGRESRAAFERVGFEFTRQRRSHMMLRHRDPPHRRLVIPDHRELAKGTPRGLIRDAGLTVEQFVELINK